MVNRPFQRLAKAVTNAYADDVPATAEAAEAVQRGLALKAQSVLRMAVIVGVFAELIVFPPWRNTAASLALAALYGVWTLWIAVWAWTDRLTIRPVVLVFGDLVALSSLLLVTGELSEPIWYATLIDDAFLFISVMAAFQFEPKATLTVAFTAAALYIGCVGFGESQGQNPYWRATLMQGLYTLVLGLGCALLSAVQGRRVRMIQGLLSHQAWLLDRVMTAEERERNELAEALHDGALQTVYASLLLIERAARAQPHPLLDEADDLLCQVSAQLRNSVTALHSEVLRTQGLDAALQAAADKSASAGGFRVRVDCATPTAGTTMDKLLYRSVTELLSNVVKHARARHVDVTLRAAGKDGWVRLEVADDGVGLSPETVREKQTAGHIGLSSQRHRIEGAGGSFSIRDNTPSGTVVTIEVPVSDD